MTSKIWHHKPYKTRHLNIAPNAKNPNFDAGIRPHGWGIRKEQAEMDYRKDM